MWQVGRTPLHYTSMSFDGHHVLEVFSALSSSPSLCVCGKLQKPCQKPQNLREARLGVERGLLHLPLHAAGTWGRFLFRAGFCGCSTKIVDGCADMSGNNGRNLGGFAIANQLRW